jgi:hypothetical protein
MTSDAVKRTDVPEEFKPKKLGATPPQIKYMRDLVDRKPLEDESRRAANKRLDTQEAANDEHQADHGPGNWPYIPGGISKRDASAWIERLLAKNDDPGRKKDKYGGKTAGGNMPSAEALPSGRYALLIGEEGVDQNDWHFFKVKRGTRNPDVAWIHRIAGDDEWEMQFNEGLKIARQIVDAGIGKAASDYGEQKKCCSRCGRGLTRRISRKLHIGPVCGGHFYQDWDERLAAARDELRAEGLDPDENIEEA